MSRIQKLLSKFNKEPIPNDITYDEFWKIAQYYGFEDKPGGRHHLIKSKETGAIMPVPIHGKTVPEVYIKKAKELFAETERGVGNK